MLLGVLVGTVIGLALFTSAYRTRERQMMERFGRDLSLAERERFNIERTAGFRDPRPSWGDGSDGIRMCLRDDRSNVCCNRRDHRSDPQLGPPRELLTGESVLTQSSRVCKTARNGAAVGVPAASVRSNAPHLVDGKRLSPLNYRPLAGFREGRVSVRRALTADWTMFRARAVHRL